MKKQVLIVAILITLIFIGCTQNQRAKSFGGNANINLPFGKKLVTVTWKDKDLWYLTKPMKANDEAETYTFQEESSWGLMEGTVTIIETKN